MWCVVGTAMVKVASKNYLSIFNAHAALKVAIYKISVFQENSANSSGNMARGYRLFRFGTVHSGGVLSTPRRLNSALPALDPAITCRIDGPATLTSEAEPIGCGMLAEQGDKYTGSSINDLFDFRWFLIPQVINTAFRFEMRPIVLNTNQGIVIRQDGFAGSGLLSASAYFSILGD